MIVTDEEREQIMSGDEEKDTALPHINKQLRADGWYDYEAENEELWSAMSWTYGP